MPKYPENELHQAAALALEVATRDGAKYEKYHWRNSLDVNQNERLKHAYDHIGLALYASERGDTENPEHHLEHALADIAIALARRAENLP